MDAFLRGRHFTSRQAEGIKAAFLFDESKMLADGASLWDVTVGITAYARGLTWQNDRVEIERKGGEVLALAA